MNKTITINIAGIVFHIDEPAYEALRNYLQSIRAHFAGSEGRDEIIHDIEARVAEMFQSKLNDAKQVILMEDITDVVAAMSKPEDFGDEQEPLSAPHGGYSSAGYEGAPSKKRLFRDPDDKVLGGVCSGISAYLDVEPVWLRLAFFASVFFFGFGFPLYIVLWIIMPVARTTAEKLQMKGERVNIENIERSIKDEIGHMKTRLKGLKDEARDLGRQHTGLRGFTARFIDLVGQIVTVLLKVFLKVIAIAFVIMGLFALVILFAMIAGFNSFSDINFPFIYSSFFFNSPVEKTLTLLSMGLIIGIPFFLMLYKGVRMLFNMKVKSRIVNMSLLVLWIVGLAIGTVIGFNVAAEFSQKQSVKRTLPVMSPKSQTLYLEAPDTVSQSYNLSWNKGVVYSNRGAHNTFIYSNNTDEPLYLKNVVLNIDRSNTDQFELVQVNIANGKTRTDALRSAQNINYSFSQKDSVVTLSPGFLLLRNEMFRDQRVKLILKVPLGKEVYLDETLDGIIYDIDNVTDMYDGDMLDHKWLMTETGLKCQDCVKAYDSNNDRHHHHSWKWKSHLGKEFDNEY